MQELINVKAKQTAISANPVISLRRVRANLELFSLDVIVFMTVLFVMAGFFVVNSYMKSYRNAQLVKITQYADINRSAAFKKNDLETEYMKIMSIDSMMQKAEALNLKIATKEKVMTF